MDALNSILSVDFQKIFVFVLIYIAVLWILICVWVYNDAKKRYQTGQLSLIFFLLVLILNFPALIFYLIVRPETEEEHVFYMHDNAASSSDLNGVNVPIVNFIGEDGFRISLQLNVANPKSDKASNLDINLDWKSNDEAMKVQEKKKEEPKLVETVKVQESDVKANSEVKNSGFTAKIKNAQVSAKNKFNGAKTKVSLSMKKFSKKPSEAPKQEKKDSSKK